MINWGTIIVSFVSFLLGLVGSLFVQWWTDRKRLNRIKGALKLHLRDIISKECITLKSEFQKIANHIANAGRGEMTFSSCKTFDAEIYKANNPSDYYKIYGEKKNNKFDKLVSTYALVSYLKENLPSKVYASYLKDVADNLPNPINTGKSENQLIKESWFFQNLRADYVGSCNSLISEIEELNKLIKEFIE